MDTTKNKTNKTSKTKKPCSGKGIAISVSLSKFDEMGLDNVERFITNNSDLIKKLLGADNTEVLVENNRVYYPWFKNSVARAEAIRCCFILTERIEAKYNRSKRAIIKPVKEVTIAIAQEFLFGLGFDQPEYEDFKKTMLNIFASQVN